MTIEQKDQSESVILFIHKNSDHKYEKQSLNLSTRADLAEEAWIKQHSCVKNKQETKYITPSHKSEKNRMII